MTAMVLARLLLALPQHKATVSQALEAKHSSILILMLRTTNRRLAGPRHQTLLLINQRLTQFSRSILVQRQPNRTQAALISSSILLSSRQYLTTCLS